MSNQGTRWKHIGVLKQFKLCFRSISYFEYGFNQTHTFTLYYKSINFEFIISKKSTLKGIKFKILNPFAKASCKRIGKTSRNDFTYNLRFSSLTWSIFFCFLQYLTKELQVFSLKNMFRISVSSSVYFVSSLFM